MPVALIPAAVSAGEFAYTASQAGDTGSTGPTIVKLTPDQQTFFENQALQAQANEDSQTQAYVTADANRTAVSAILKWGLAIVLIWFLWKAAKKRHLF